MLRVLHFSKKLAEPLDVTPATGVRVVTYAGNTDNARWVQVRQQAWANSPTHVRLPNITDLERELLTRRCWRPNWLWFAESVDGREPQTLGTVGLALRESRQNKESPCIVRLAVIPEARRRGIGRLLMQTLERAAWQAGYRQLWLETHATWKDAVALYRSLGWELDRPTPVVPRLDE